MPEGRKTKTVFYVMCPECSKAMKVEAEFDASPVAPKQEEKEPEKKEEVAKHAGAGKAADEKPGVVQTGDKHSTKGKEVPKE